MESKEIQVWHLQALIGNPSPNSTLVGKQSIPLLEFESHPRLDGLQQEHELLLTADFWSHQQPYQPQVPSPPCPHLAAVHPDGLGGPGLRKSQKSRI